MEAGTLFDTESFREALGPAAFAELERTLQDQYAAQLCLYAKEAARIRAASDRLEWAANENIHGLRGEFNMSPLLYAHLNVYEQGWQDDPSFVRDLHRHEPTTRIRMKTGGATNRVGWTPSLNNAAGPRHTASKEPAPVNRKLVLTDERGNAQ